MWYMGGIGMHVVPLKKNRRASVTLYADYTVTCHTWKTTNDTWWSMFIYLL